MTDKLANCKDVTAHELIVAFPELTAVSALKLTPRQADANGRFLNISIYASATADGDDFVCIVDNYVYDTEANAQDAVLGIADRTISLGANVSAQRIKIVVNNGMWTRAALNELNAYGADATLEDKTVDDYA